MNVIPFYSSTKTHFQLSNFHPCEIFINNYKYSSSEHYYQQRKAATLGASQELIDSIPKYTCALAKYSAKKLEKEATIDQLEEWQKIKIEVMKRALFSKFSQNTNLLSILMETGDAILVEASPSDNFWGAGTYEATILREKRWPGANVMGKLLSNLRSECRFPFYHTKPSEPTVFLIFLFVFRVLFTQTFKEF
uniref:NADAR domain-containing protein n=1 Tax=Meloidogyne incognita TaxID=6306 RepID=A0A914NMI4_MELIC